MHFRAKAAAGDPARAAAQTPGSDATQADAVSPGQDRSQRQSQFHIAVLSDTHGYLPPAALRACADVDLIVHAGDICADDIIDRLEMRAPVIAVLGNNDWPGEYGPLVGPLATFERMGVSFKVTHIPARLGELDTRVAICGHTHVPRIEDIGACTLVNPGSVTRPRGPEGPTMAHIVLEENYVRSARIIRLDDVAHLVD